MRTPAQCPLVSVLWPAILCLALGCGSGDDKIVIIGTVSGRVTLDGKPVQSGCVITFLPTSAGAEIGSGLVGEDGIYKAISGDHPGMPVGDYKVIVSPPPLPPEEEAELTRKNSQAVMNALIMKSREELDKVEYPQAEIVPRKYWTEVTSGLAFSVSEGVNSADFKLVPEKTD